MARFLSRREKNHDKRRSKSASRKVMQRFLPSRSTSRSLAASTDGSGLLEPDRKRPRRSNSNSVRSLCSHTVPNFLSLLRPEGLGILAKRPACTQMSFFYVQTSTALSSDSLTLQSQTVPSDLYTIFSNETSKKPEKEDNEKVCSYFNASSLSVYTCWHCLRSLGRAARFRHHGYLSDLCILPYDHLRSLEEFTTQNRGLLSLSKS